MTIFHGWESADNAPRFDRALARIDADGVEPIERTDTLQVAADERPTDLDYRRYVALVAWLRERGYRPRPVSSSPFAYLDLPLNSILAVAEDDLALLQERIGRSGDRARAGAASLRSALAHYVGRGRGRLPRARPPRRRGGHRHRRRPLPALCRRSGRAAGAAACRRAPARADAVRACAGVALGGDDGREVEPRLLRTELLARAGLDQRQLVPHPGPRALRARGGGERRSGSSTLELVRRSGFSEYYEPATGAPLGSRVFSWSAALTLDLIRDVRP